VRAMMDENFEDKADEFAEDAAQAAEEQQKT
jgi:hypothetical protein